MRLSTNSGVTVNVVHDERQTRINADTSATDRGKAISVVLVETFSGTVRISTHNDGTVIASLENESMPFAWQHDTHTLRITRIGE